MGMAHIHSQVSGLAALGAGGDIADVPANTAKYLACVRPWGVDAECLRSNGLLAQPSSERQIPSWCDYVPASQNLAACQPLTLNEITAAGMVDWTHACRNASNPEACVNDAATAFRKDMEADARNPRNVGIECLTEVRKNNVNPLWAVVPDSLIQMFCGLSGEDPETTRGVMVGSLFAVTGLIIYAIVRRD